MTEDASGCPRTAPGRPTTKEDRSAWEPASASARSIDDLDVLLAALPPEIVDGDPCAAGPRGRLIEVVLDLGRRPEARYPDVARSTLLDREIGETRHRLRRRPHRLVRRRQPRGHRAHAPPHQRDPQPERQDRRADLPDRPRRLRDDRDHRGLHRDREVDPDHGPAGHRQDHDAPRGRPRAGRRAAASASSSSTPRTRSRATATSRTRRSARPAGCRCGRRACSTR